MKKKILVIEDDEKITAALAIRLEANGYDVLTAPNGFEGLKSAMEQKPDLLIMDIWMPSGIGFSVVQRIHDLGLSDIPVIFMTGSKLPGLRRTAKKLGAAAFFEKPYDPAELMNAILLALTSPPVLQTP